MLSRLDYENLRAASPALRRGDRRVGVLLRDPAMADQLALVGAVLPQKQRIGVVATPESEPLVRELQRAAQGGSPPWDVQVEYAPDAKSLAAALRAVVPRSDSLMVLPDLIGDSQAATQANTGVQGTTQGSGTGGYFSSPTGNAIRVQGKASFSRAGRTSIPKNRSYVDVTVSGGLASSAFVIATLQAARTGVWVSSVRINYPTSGKARIQLNKVASTTATTPVGWIVIG